MIKSIEQNCKRRSLHRFTGLLQASDGGMLVEFAFVAPFVILIMTATIELAMTLFVGATLEGAAESAARQIRTGQVQQTTNPVAAFQTKLCEQLFNLIDCSKVTFDVRAFSDFASADEPLVFDEDGELVGATFAPGNSGEITVVRVLYRWHYLTPLVTDAIGGANGTLLLATMAFQNEPYELGG